MKPISINAVSETFGAREASPKSTGVGNRGGARMPLYFERVGPAHCTENQLHLRKVHDIPYGKAFLDTPDEAHKH